MVQIASRAEGSLVFSTVSSTPVCSCGHGVIADRRRLFRLSFRPFSRPRTRAPRACSALCDDAATIAVLPAPLAPWTGAPLRVIVAAEKPLDGRAVADRARRQRRGQIARAPRRAAVFLVRRDAVAGRGDVARELCAAAGCSTVTRDIVVRATPPRRRPGGGQHLAVAQYLEPRDGKPLFGVDRKTVRRAARRGAVVAGAARGAARPLAQFPVQLSGPRRRRDEDRPASRLRRPPYFLRAYFAFKMGLPFGYLEMLARRRRQPAECCGMVQHPECRRRARRAGRGR